MPALINFDVLQTVHLLEFAEPSTNSTERRPAHYRNICKQIN